MLANATVLPPRRWASANAASQATTTSAAVCAVCGKLATPIATVKRSSWPSAATIWAAHWRRRPSMRECAVARPTPESSTAKCRSSVRHDASMARVLPRSSRPMASKMRCWAAEPARSTSGPKASKAMWTRANSRCSRVDKSTSRRIWSSKWARVYKPLAWSRKPWSATSCRKAWLALCSCSSCSSTLRIWASRWRWAALSCHTQTSQRRPSWSARLRSAVKSRRWPCQSKRWSLGKALSRAVAVWSAARSAVARVESNSSASVWPSQACAGRPNKSPKAALACT